MAEDDVGACGATPPAARRAQQAHAIMSLAASTAALRVAADARAVLAAASRALVRAEKRGPFKRAAKYAAIELPLERRVARGECCV